MWWIMSFRIRTASAALLAVFMILMTGCGSNNPVSAFEPEIINNADAFQFQITGGSNVSTTLSYQWNNTNTQATIDHSTALTAGSAAVTIFDADSNQVYTSGLLTSGNETSGSGTAGAWTITVVFADFDGTVNFRVEKL